MNWPGFVDPSHPLSPRAAFTQLNPASRRLVVADAASLWEQDNEMLPSALRRYRAQQRDYAQRVIAPQVAAIDADPKGPAVDALLAQFARDGLLTDFLPPPAGTFPLALLRHAPLAMAIKLEEMSVACSGIALLAGAHGLGLLPILMAGDLGLMGRVVLPSFARMKRGEPVIFAYALTEPSGGSDVEDSHAAALYRPGTVARRVKGGWQLNGRKVFISGGDRAAWIAVFAALEGEGMESTTCFLVDRRARGFTCVRTEHKMGQRASQAAELLFEDLFVPDSHVVGAPRRGWAINRAVLNVSRIPVAALALGIARGAMERAIAVLASTGVPGEPLLQRQSVQQGVAQMMIDVSAMRAVVWQAASQPRSRQARSSIAKVFCSDTAVKVCRLAMDLVGETALTADAGVEKCFRDARLTQIYEGTNQINRLAIIEDQLDWLMAMQQGDTR